MSKCPPLANVDQCNVPAIGIEIPECSIEAPVPEEHAIAASFKAIDDAKNTARIKLTDEIEEIAKELHAACDEHQRTLLGHSSEPQQSSGVCPTRPCSSSAAYQFEHCPSSELPRDQYVAVDIRSRQSTPVDPVQTRPPPVPLWEATAFPQQPVYDVVAVYQNSNSLIAWWKHHKKHLFVGVLLLVVGILAGAVGSTNNSNGNEDIGTDTSTSTLSTPEPNYPAGLQTVS